MLTRLAGTLLLVSVLTFLEAGTRAAEYSVRLPLGLQELCARRGLGSVS
ncbi:MAG: hypothetical protein HYV04_02135 [Deltaproteobacteria bacterium]|nr:hypothetical protein [Deltaproteobacteria bacterium]